MDKVAAESNGAITLPQFEEDGETWTVVETAGMLWNLDQFVAGHKNGEAARPALAVQNEINDAVASDTMKAFLAMALRVGPDAK